VGSLFSRYPSRPAWSRRGLLSRLAWVRCSHTPCVGSLLSHALLGLVVLAVSVTPGVVSSRSSHTPCVGSLFVSWGLVVAAPVTGREVGLWREIIDCVEKKLQTSYRALPLYFSFPLWNHSLPARLTQFPSTMTQSLRPRKTHDRTRPPRGQHCCNISLVA